MQKITIVLPEAQVADAYSDWVRSEVRHATAT